MNLSILNRKTEYNRQKKKEIKINRFLPNMEEGKLSWNFYSAPTTANVGCCQMSIIEKYIQQQQQQQDRQQPPQVCSGH
jgi:hypothetical protein